MSNTESTSVEQVTWARITQRSLHAFCMFSIALLVIMTFSWFVVLPQLTRIELDGSLVDIDTLQGRHKGMAAQILEREEKRNQLILPIQDVLYTQLRDWKYHHTDYRYILSAIEQNASRLSENKQNVVHIADVHLQKNTDKSTLTLTGDVRNVGPRSMTVLAQFTESIRTVIGVSEVSMPRFERKNDPDIGAYTPFTISVSLQ